MVKLEERAVYIAYLIIGIVFVIVGSALNELTIIETVNSWSVGNDVDLERWYDFLRPFVGDQDNGLPTPW